MNSLLRTFPTPEEQDMGTKNIRKTLLSYPQHRIVYTILAKFLIFLTGRSENGPRNRSLKSKHFDNLTWEVDCKDKVCLHCFKDPHHGCKSRAHQEGYPLIIAWTVVHAVKCNNQWPLYQLKDIKSAEWKITCRTGINILKYTPLKPVLRDLHSGPDLKIPRTFEKAGN